MIDFRPLGPVQARVGAHALDLGPPRQRAVLAAIAADAGRPVPTEAVIDRVWGESPPAHARATLHVYVVRLRVPLGEAAPLVRRSGGYLLDVEPDRVDALRFRALVAQARDPSCPDASRVALLADALALWGGTPLAGLSGDWFDRVRQGWELLRQEAIAAWAEGDLGLGNPTAAIGPLSDAVAEHPLAEHLAALLVRALHGAGLSARWWSPCRVPPGYAQAELGRHAQAIESYRRAADLNRSIGDLRSQAAALTSLGDAYEATGDAGAAEAVRRQARAILDELQLI